MTTTPIEITTRDLQDRCKDLREQIAVKAALIGDWDGKLQTLNVELGELALADEDTTDCRNAITMAERRIWEIGKQRADLETQLDIIAEKLRGRALQARLAERYRTDLEFLRARLEVVRLGDELDAARARVPKHFSAHRGTAYQRWRQEHSIELATMTGVHSDGGNTVDEVAAQIERFEQLAHDAEAASR